MANSEVSRLKFNNITYEIADELARERVGTALTEVASVEAKADAYNMALSGRITNLENSSGAVLVAKTRTAMIDTNKIYVYTGSESGMTRGNWYYHNGSAWVSGGAYNQNLDAIDATLTQSNKGADAKVTGDRLTAAETNSVQYRGILNTTTVTPDTVSEIGYWGCNHEIVTNILGETHAGGIFFNLRQPPNDFLQMFVLVDGLVFARYQKNGEFVSHNIGIQRVPLSNPDTVIKNGIYTSPASVTAQYTGVNLFSMFVCLTTPANSVAWQGFLLSDGSIYSRYGNTGDFRRVLRNITFAPTKALTAWIEDSLLKVKIPVCNITLPPSYNNAFPIQEEIVLSEIDRGTFGYAVLDTSFLTIGRPIPAEAFSVIPRNQKLKDSQIVLFVFLYNQILNACVTPQMFPTRFSGKTKTVNDYFAPMFNRTGTPFKIVLGGDSITHGVGGTGFAQNGETIVGSYKRNPDGFCWANLFKDYIESNYNAVVINNGTTGTYAWWWDTYKEQLIPADTDLFILTLGTNQRIKSEGRNGTTHDEQITNYYIQMNRILEYCESMGVPVLLCSSIPATKSNEDSKVDGEPQYPSHVFEYNGVLQRIASEHNTAYINMYDAVFRYVDEHGLTFDELLPDGLHPGDKMYRIMYYKYMEEFGLAPTYIPVEPNAAVNKYVITNILEKFRKVNRTDYYGITATWNADGSCSIAGTNTQAVGVPFLSKSPIPSFIIPGKTYSIRHNSDEIQFSVALYDSNDNTIMYKNITSDTLLTILEDTSFITIQYRVPPGSHDTVVYSEMLSDIPGIDLFREINNSFDSLTRDKMRGLIQWEEGTPSQVEEGKLFSEDGLVDNNLYTAYKFSVNPGKLVKFTGIQGSIRYLLARFFNSRDYEIANTETLVETGAGTKTFIMTVPKESSYVWVNTINQTGGGMSKETSIITDPLEFLSLEKEYKVVKTSVGVVITYGSFEINLRNIGANDIFNLYSLKHDSSLVFATNTDWYGPYNFTKVGGASSPTITTGGNHSYTQDEVTVTTGRTVEWKVYLDKKEIVYNGNYGADEIEITWHNEVMAGNTVKIDGSGEYCLDEYYRVRIVDGLKLETEHYFVPKVDCMLRWYSGLQFASGTSLNKVLIPSYTDEVISTSLVSTKAVPYKVVNRCMAFNKDINVMCEMFLDRTWGMPSNVVESSMTGASDSKMYFTQQGYADESIRIKANSMYCWRGYYKFSEMF